MKILFGLPVINIELLKDLKDEQHSITYNKNEPDIDVIVDDKNIYFKKYPEFSMAYKHWIQKEKDLSFIINLLEETLQELKCYSF